MKIIYLSSTANLGSMPANQLVVSLHTGQQTEAKSHPISLGLACDQNVEFPALLDQDYSN